MPARAVEHQAAQAGLVALLSRELVKLWPHLDVQRLGWSLPRLTAAVAHLTRRYGLASGAAAADFYAAQRAAAGVGGRFAAMPADPPPLGQVRSGVDWATKGLWSRDPDVRAAQVLLDGAVEKLVLDVGRATLIEAVRSDREAKGWARTVEPGACSFCLLLAIRGPVYKEDSFDESNERFVGLGEFKTHNNCRCDLQPLFATEWEPSADVRHWKGVYEREPRGLSSSDRRRVFRQAVEGRLPEDDQHI